MKGNGGGSGLEGGDGAVSLPQVGACVLCVHWQAPTRAVSMTRGSREGVWADHKWMRRGRLRVARAGVGAFGGGRVLTNGQLRVQ